MAGITALVAGAAGAASAASAAYTITDPSFELSGGTITGSATFGGNTEAATIDVGKPFSGMSADKWQTHSGQDNGRTAELESTTSYGTGRTTAPANATGNYWFHGQRSSTQGRGFMQYTQDSGQTTGLLTVSMDYWVYENRASPPTSARQHADTRGVGRLTRHPRTSSHQTRL